MNPEMRGFVTKAFTDLFKKGHCDSVWALMPTLVMLESWSVISGQL